MTFHSVRRLRCWPIHPLRLRQWLLCLWATAMISGETELMGTPGYMAPEAILGHADIDRRVDVYAVGRVAYFLLTGERVFGAANIQRTTAPCSSR